MRTAAQLHADFFANIHLDISGCWLWMGSPTTKNYGYYHNDGAHRIAYEIFYHTKPQKFEVLHTCDTKLCVNPDHLWLGTQKDNMQDRQRKGRAKGTFNSGVDTRRTAIRDSITGRFK